MAPFGQAPAAPRIPDGQRIYAIGDIHGRLDLLERLVADIRRDSEGRPSAQVRIVLLGDIVDRGPDAAALVRRCMALVARGGGRFVVLKGNHEAMMVHAVRGNFNALAMWLRHGGDATLRSFDVAEPLIAQGASPELLAAARAAIPSDLLAWLDTLPLSLRIGGYLFVHAGIRPGVDLGDQTAEDMLWIRGEFLESQSPHPLVVVHGHSETEDGVDMRANRIGIDTAAYRSGTLSALGLEGTERWTLATADIAA